MVLKSITTKVCHIGRQSVTITVKSTSRRQPTAAAINSNQSESSRQFHTYSLLRLPQVTVTNPSINPGLKLNQLQQQVDLEDNLVESTHLQVQDQAIIDDVEDYNIGINENVEALYLTPYLRSAQIAEAQNAAAVTALTDKIQSYSGYLTVNEKFNSNLFFWFFPALHNPEEAPVLLWLNGGPGASSLFGLFAGNGPIFVDRNQQLQLRKNPWSLNHSVLYIDSPVGTGFSFTDNEAGYARSLADVTNDLYEALQQFFTLFPTFRPRDFYVTGQSYTGKYAPAISYKIHQENKILHPESRINLRGMAIGCGLCDPETQADYGEFLYNIGLIDEQEKKYFDKEYEKLLVCIKSKNWTEAHKILQKLVVGWPRPIVSHFENITGYSFNSNYLQENMPEEYGLYINFIKKDEVRKSIHVGNHDFGIVRDKVYNYLSDDFAKSVKFLVEELLDEDYKILFYASQLDVIVPHTGISKFIGSLKWKHSEDYLNQQRNLWRVKNEIAGYYKSSHNLVHLLLRNAGHSAPLEQPERCLDMITRFTTGRSFGN